jgi:hypothetical protein
MSEDHAAIVGPVTARHEDVTDISSIGLLPQLIDVLRALAEGQELLLRKIRDAKLENTSTSVLVVDRYPQAEADNGELRAGPTSGNCPGNGSSSEPGIEASVGPGPATAVGAAPLSDPLTETQTDVGPAADLSSERTPRTEEFNSARHDETATGMGTGNHNYNFFDELDARLADLQDPVHRSEDS